MVRVDIDPAGKVYNVQSDLIPDSVLVQGQGAELAASGIAKEEAIAKALTATGSTGDSPHTIHSTEQVAYPVDGQPTPAWKVVVVGDAAGEWKVYVGRERGSGGGEPVEGSARPHLRPHPVATLNDTTLEDSSTLEPAYTEVELVGLDGSGNLDAIRQYGEHPARIKRDDGQFLFRRADQPFKEVMVYFHIDRVQRYLQQLGFMNVLNGPVRVNVVGRSTTTPTTAR